MTKAALKEMRQTCVTHAKCSSWTLPAPLLISEILVTVIGLNNKGKAGLTASRDPGSRQ